MTTSTYTRRGKPRGGAFGSLPRAAAIGLALTLPLAACDLDELLRVDDPTFLTPDRADLDLLVDGAVGDFQRAFAGGLGNPGMHSEGYVSVSAAMSDEFKQGDTFTTRQRTDERRQFSPADGNTSDWAYTGLHQARRAAHDAANALPDGDARFPEIRSLEGYAYLALGEGWCGAVPVSFVEDGAFVDGPMRSTQELFREAVGIFENAGTDYNLAAVGKARAHLSLGEYAEAGTAAAAVPLDWVYFVEHSDNTARQRNAIYGLQNNGRWTQADREGGNGLPFRSAMDPRTPWFHAGAAFDESVPLYVTMLHPGHPANVVLADGIEAQLIRAEAALHTGGDWLGMLNELRANYQALMTARYPHLAGLYGDEDNPFGDLAPLTDPGTHEGRVDLIFQERGFWLYTRGTRLGDLRRLVREYGRNQADVFPVGEHHRGGSYGADVNFPVPFDEENNPLFERAACDVTQA